MYYNPVKAKYIMGDMMGGFVRVFCKGDVEAPKPSKTQRKLENLQYQTLVEQNALYNAMKPYILQEAGYKEIIDPVTGKKTYAQMTDAERYAAMDELEKSQYDIAKSTAARQQQALAGTLPLSPALVEQLEKQKSDLESYYSQKLGPRYKESTPYIQAMGELTKKQGLLTQEYQTGQMTAGEALMLQSLGGYGGYAGGQLATAGALPAYKSGLLGGVGQGLGYWGNQQQMQGQYALANAQREAGLMGALGGLTGTLGSGLFVGGGMAGGMGKLFKW